MPELSPEITSALAILSRVSESVSAVTQQAGETNRFSQALGALQSLSIENDIPIAIVGGLGAIRYGYPAATQDIAVAIGQQTLDAFILAAPRYGFKIAWRSSTGWHTLMHGDVEINVVPERGRAHDSSQTTIPSPGQMGVAAGLSYARLEGWIELKVSSGRQKDLAHVVEVLKKTDQLSIQIVRDHLASVNAQYLASFDRLHSESQAEREQEDRRR